MLWKKVEPKARIGHDMPRPRVGHTVTAVGKMLYMFGGQIDNRATNELWILDTETQQWMNPQSEMRGAYPSARYRHSALYAKKLDRIIIFGGVGGGALLHLLDPNYPEHIEWLSPGSLGDTPTPRFSFFMDLKPNNPDVLVVFGGWSSSKSALNDYYELSMPSKVRDFREKAMMAEVDAEIKMPRDDKLLEQTPWVERINKQTGKPYYIDTVSGRTAEKDPRPAWLVARKKEEAVRLEGLRAELQRKKRDMKKMVVEEEVWRWDMPEAQEGTPPHDCSKSVVILEGERLHVFGAEGNTEYIFHTTNRTWSRMFDDAEDYPMTDLIRHAQTGFTNEKFVHGGMVARRGGDVESDMYTWSSEQQLWVKMFFGGAMPPARFNHAMCCVGFGVYLVYGMNRDGVLDDIWMFDASPMPWESLSFGGQTLGNRLDGAAVVSLFDKVPKRGRKDEYTVVPAVYAVGGQSGNTALNDVWRLDLPNTSWERLEVEKTQATPEALVSHTAVLHKHRIFVFGGGDGKVANNTNRLVVFNCLTRRWEKVETTGAAPAARIGHSATYADGSMWVFGGYCKGLFFSDIHHLEFATMKWLQEHPRSTRPPTRFAHSAASPVNGKEVWVFGGMSKKGPLNDLWRFSCIDRVWHRPRCVGIAPSQRFAHCAEFVNDKMFVFGGSRMADSHRLCFNDVFVLDTGMSPLVWSRPRVSQWKPDPRYRMSSFVHQNNVFVFGGGNGQQQFVDFSRLITGEEEKEEFAIPEPSESSEDEEEEEEEEAADVEQEQQIMGILSPQAQQKARARRSSKPGAGQPADDEEDEDEDEDEDEEDDEDEEEEEEDQSSGEDVFGAKDDEGDWVAPEGLEDDDADGAARPAQGGGEGERKGSGARDGQGTDREEAESGAARARKQVGFAQEESEQGQEQGQRKGSVVGEAGGASAPAGEARPKRTGITRRDEQRAFEALLHRHGLGEWVPVFRTHEVGRDTFVRMNHVELRELGLVLAKVLQRANDLQDRMRAVPVLKTPPNAPPHMRRVLCDRYYLLERISWGGSPVLLAYDLLPSLPRPRFVAVKVHPVLHVFHHERYMLQTAPPAYVAPLVGAYEGVPNIGHCLVVEFAETLSDYIATTHISSTERRVIIEQIAELVTYFHEKGGVLCTLSPRAIAEYGNRWKLVNCEGIRKHGDRVPPAFDACYAAPELIRSMKAKDVSKMGVKAKHFDKHAAATRRMDSWSFGLIVFELFTKEPMFQNELDAIVAAGCRGPIAATTLGAVDNKQARELILQCLQVHTKKRLPMRSVKDHALLQGQLDSQSFNATFGELERGLRTVLRGGQSVKEINKQRLKDLEAKLEREKAWQDEEERKRQEEAAKREIEERSHPKNRWKEAVREHQEEMERKANPLFGVFS